MEFALTIIFGIIGIVGTVAGIFSYMDSRETKKQLRDYKYIFDAAEKNITKDNLDEELDLLYKKKEEMDNAIEHEIPLRAQLTVLKDRIKAEEENLAVSYKRYISIREEYDRLNPGEETSLPQEILDTIEQKILPEYLVREQRDRKLRQLAIISYVVALLSINPVTRLFGYILVLYTVVPLYDLLILYLPKEKKKRKEFFIRVLLVLLVILNVIVALLFAQSLQPWYEYLQGPVLIAALLLSFLDLAVFILFIVKRVRAAKKGA